MISYVGVLLVCLSPITSDWQEPEPKMPFVSFNQFRIDDFFLLPYLNFDSSTKTLALQFTVCSERGLLPNEVRELEKKLGDFEIELVAPGFSGIEFTTRKHFSNESPPIFLSVLRLEQPVPDDLVIEIRFKDEVKFLVLPYAAYQQISDDRPKKNGNRVPIRFAANKSAFKTKNCVFFDQFKLDSQQIDRKNRVKVSVERIRNNRFQILVQLSSDSSNSWTVDSPKVKCYLEHSNGTINLSKMSIALNTNGHNRKDYFNVPKMDLNVMSACKIKVEIRQNTYVWILPSNVFADEIKAIKNNERDEEVPRNK